VRYPFLPQPKRLDPKNPLTRGISQVAFPFMSPLTVKAKEGGDVRAEVLIESSPKSWVQKPPYDLNPMQRWTLDALGEPSAQKLAVALSGPIASHFGTSDAAAQGGAEADKGEQEKSSGGRVLVVGGSSFLQDQFLAPGNQALVLNLLDWLVLDDALLAVRSRGLEAAPLKELDERQRAAIRYANVIGLPVAMVLFGIGRWRMRERRRSRVHV
jgi:ABC-type uncharacterized transport system involved in gliding motility auxiliary subunit